MRVLVVNDEPRLARRDRDVLQAAGFEVTDAPSAADGLRELSTDQPDLVILDLAHVDVAGLDLLADVRALAPDVFVIVLSAAPDRSDCIAALVAGADDCLPQPFSADELLARIAAMRRRRSHAAGVSSRLQEIVTGVTSEVTDAVIIITPDHRIHGFNPAAEELYGWRAEEVVGEWAGMVLRWVGADRELDRARDDLAT
ncbi:MAG: DNA-binding response regulator, partial [Actinomycetia bacterium]|nr:DNA-binding response regulator [Actinomycetes bacterium]